MCNLLLLHVLFAANYVNRIESSSSKQPHSTIAFRSIQKGEKVRTDMQTRRYQYPCIILWSWLVCGWSGLSSVHSLPFLWPEKDQEKRGNTPERGSDGQLYRGPSAYRIWFFLTVWQKEDFLGWFQTETWARRKGIHFNCPSTYPQSHCYHRLREITVLPHYFSSEVWFVGNQAHYLGVVVNFASFAANNFCGTQHTGRIGPLKEFLWSVDN